RALGTQAGPGQDEMRGGRSQKSIGEGNRGGGAPAIDECGGLPHFGHCAGQPDRFRWGESEMRTPVYLSSHTSSNRQPLKTLLTTRLRPLTRGRQQVAARV